jgi:alpha-mannosidase
MLPEDSARFCDLPVDMLDPIRVVEDGPVRTVVEALYTFNKSTIVTHYIFPKTGTEIEISMRVHWSEKTKMLKLSIPLPPGDYQYYGQVVYGAEELPGNGDEAVSQKWCAVVDKEQDFAFTCINSGTYGSDFSDEGLRLTLLRSPVYAGEEIDKIPQDRYTPRVDQGVRCFKFWFNVGTVKERLGQIDREALVKNEEPYALSFFPPGKGKKPKALLSLSDPTIQLTALKYAQEEDENDVIFRLFNPTDKRQKTQCQLPLWGFNFAINFEPFEIKSFKVDVEELQIIEVDLMEREIASL